MGVTQNAGEPGVVFQPIEGVPARFFVEGHLQFDSGEKTIDANAEFDQGLILFFGKIPHADYPTIYLFAEEPPCAKDP